MSRSVYFFTLIMRFQSNLLTVVGHNCYLGCLVFQIIVIETICVFNGCQKFNKQYAAQWYLNLLHDISMSLLKEAQVQGHIINMQFALRLGGKKSAYKESKFEKQWVMSKINVFKEWNAHEMKQALSRLKLRSINQVVKDFMIEQ